MDWLRIALVVSVLAGCFASKKSWIGPKPKKPKNHCAFSPKWEGNGTTDPMSLFRSRGELVVVTLIRGDCHYCRALVESMGILAAYYDNMGWRKIRFIAVNHQSSISRLPFILKGPKVEVYQLDANATLWKDLGGRDKDVFIYDACGRLQFQLSFPYSYPGYYFLTAAIHNAFKFPKYVCGRCQVPLVPTQNIPLTPTAVPQTQAKAEFQSG